MAGGASNFDNNLGGEIVTVDVTSEYDEGWFLALSVDIGDNMGVVDAILTDPTRVKEFQQNVNAACDEFLAKHEKSE